MIKSMPILFAVLIAATSPACGGGGGGGGAADTGFTTLDAAPSDAVLCSFIIGETTPSHVMDALGEATSYSENEGGAFLQYWVGQIGTGPVRGVFLGFGPDGTLDSPSVQELPFPQCWRDQLDARDARAGL